MARSTEGFEKALNVKVLLTGAAGFIGMHTAQRLLARGDEVIGVDNLNDYYEVSLKEARLARLTPHPGFSFHRLSVEDRAGMAGLFAATQPERVIHLAAQAGVRYSLQNPHAYIDANLQGFINILEGCRHRGAQHLVYASSSSVYGGNTALPFSEHHNIDHPVSLYAATKKANELMAHTYSHLYDLPTTGLRFFTVYGPWGRPDMALFKFTKAILAGEPIQVFNYGKMWRDFTYIDDIVEGVLAALRHVPSAKPPHGIYNLGNHRSEKLTDFISVIETSLGRKASYRFEPMQQGDVERTYADIAASRRDLGFEPRVPISEGIPKFVEWYRAYHRVWPRN